MSASLTSMTSPSAVTISAAIRLSQDSPYLRWSQPMPPPRVNPATPVVEIRPPVVASPCSAVAASRSAQVAPGCADAIRRPTSTPIFRIGERSITTPPSQVLSPATL